MNIRGGDSFPPLDDDDDQGVWPTPMEFQPTSLNWSVCGVDVGVKRMSTLVKGGGDCDCVQTGWVVVVGVINTDVTCVSYKANFRLWRKLVRMMERERERLIIMKRMKEERKMYRNKATLGA